MTARQPPREKGAKACTIGLYQSRDWYFCAYFSGSTEKWGAFLLFEESYEVCTHWGWFRLDRGAYEDYLAGKLWITWIPGKPKEQAAEQRKEDVLPPNVTDAAIRLRDLASRHGAYATFQSAFPGVAVEIPFKQRIKINDLSTIANGQKQPNQHK